MANLSRSFSGFVVALAFCAGAGAVSASAATLVKSPSAVKSPLAPAPCDGITFTGIAASGCAGGFEKNLLKGSLSLAGLAALQSLGYVGDGSFVQKLEELKGNSINFSRPLVGTTFVGIHYGGAGVKGDNATSFFRFDAGAGAGVDSFDFNRNGLSNAVLFQTGAVSAVPEPDTWAMMLIGFGAVGGAMRRRSQKVAVSYA